jgi:hypothetical protein
MLIIYFGISLPATILTFFAVYFTSKFIFKTTLVTAWKFISIGASLLWSVIISNSLKLNHAEAITVVAIFTTAFVSIILIILNKKKTKLK